MEGIKEVIRELCSIFLLDCRMIDSLPLPPAYFFSYYDPLRTFYLLASLQLDRPGVQHSIIKNLLERSQ